MKTIEKAGVCPICKTDELEYTEKYFDYENLIMPFKCVNDHDGREIYYIEYIESEGLK